jgi:hypothetical protein
LFCQAKGKKVKKNRFFGKKKLETRQKERAKKSQFWKRTVKN